MVLLVLSTGFMNETSAQDWRIDSLRHAYSNATTGSEKVHLLLTLVEETAVMSPVRTLMYAEKALSLAKHSGNASAECEALLAISLAYHRIGNTDAADEALQRAEEIVPVDDLLEQARVARARSYALDLDGFPIRAMSLLVEADSLLQFLPPEPLHVYVKHDLVVGLASQGRTEEAQQQLSIAYELANSIGDTTALAICHFAHSYLAYQHKESQRYINELELALTLFKSQGDSVGISATLLNLGAGYSEMGKMKLAYDRYMHCRSVAGRIGYRRVFAGTTMNLGIMAYQQGKLDSAMVLLVEARNIYMELEEPLSVVAAMVHISGIHDLQRRYDQALDLALNAKRILDTLGDTPLRTQIYGDIGIRYYRLGEVDSAEAYFTAAFRMEKNIGSRQRQTVGRIFYAHIKREKGDLDSAEILYREMLLTGKKIDRPLLQSAGYTGLANVAAARGDGKTADSLSRIALKLSESDGIVEQLIDALEARSRAAVLNNRYDEALAAHQRYTVLQDSILNADNLRTINELNAKYEAEQREKQIALLQKDREIKDLALARQREELRIRTLEALKRKQEIGLLEKDREIQSLELLRRDADLARQQAVTQRREHEVRLLRKDKDLQASLLERETFRRNATLAGLTALLLVTGLIFWRYREKQRSNRRLERTLGELRRTQDQLIHTEKMATLGELTAGIAHEIKNPLNFVTNFSSTSTEMVDELEAQVRSLGNGDERRQEVLTLLEELKGNMGRIHQHGQRADGIVASMLLHARSQKGVRQEADINTLLREALQLAWHGMRAQVPDFTVEIEEEYDTSLPRIEVIPQEISRVFLNVLSNAFQAVRKRMQDGSDEAYIPAVRVSTRATATGVEVRIRDNGTGIPEAIRDKIFQPFFTTKPTGEGTGLGLSLSYDIIVKGHGGEIGVESEEGRVTAFSIKLPGGTGA